MYSAVTDPVAAQLVASMEPTGTNVTGVSDLLALDKQIDLIKKIVPNAKRVGMVYNPGEANSVVVVKLQELLPKYGMSLVEAAAPRSVDVASAARSLIGKVDVIYTNTDNNVVSAYESLVKVGNDAKIPLVASDTDSVKRGGIAALGINYRDLGVQTGKVVVRILKGESPAPSPRKPAQAGTLCESGRSRQARRHAVRRADQVGRGGGEVSRPPETPRMPCGMSGVLFTCLSVLPSRPAAFLSCRTAPAAGGNARVGLVPARNPRALGARTGRIGLPGQDRARFGRKQAKIVAGEMFVAKLG